MTLKEMTENLPSWEAAAKAMGFEARRERSELVSAIEIFGAGIFLGVGLAMLLAPKTGRELRRDIKEGAAELGRQAAEFAQGLRRTETREPKEGESREATARRSQRSEPGSATVGA